MTRFLLTCLVVAAFLLVAGAGIATAATESLANNSTATATISSPTPTAHSSPTASATTTPTATADGSGGLDIDAPDVPDAPDLPGGGGGESTPTPGAEVVDDRPSVNGTRIDGNTVIKDRRYFDGRGVLNLVIHSEKTQVVTVNDAGALVNEESGVIPRKSVAMEAGETQLITLPVTEHEGYVGVGISTDETLYGLTIEAPSDGLQVLQQATTLQAWIGGIGIAFTWVVVAGWSELRREGTEPVKAS